MNTKLLSNEDIKKILYHKQKPVIIGDSMNISVFKIALHKKLLKMYIKCPIIKNRFNIYKARAISQNDGKLLISNKLAKCANTYCETSTFKKKLFKEYCTLSLENNFFYPIIKR